MTNTVVGVDWHRRGWVAIVLAAQQEPQVLVGEDLVSIIDRVPAAACIAVDMPIGLPVREREADAQARAFVGPRWQSVFSTPPAAVLEAGTYADANVVAHGLLGKKISQQAWALRQNIKRVSEVAEKDSRIIEVHPEVSFCVLLGKHVAFSKTTWNGQAIRREALLREGICLPDELGEAGNVPVADVLDAGVAAWSARRYAEKRARSLPPGAEPGQREVIWY